MLIDTIPLGPRQYIIRAWPFVGVATDIEDDCCYHCTIEIELRSKARCRREGVFHRPRARRNAVGQVVSDVVFILIEADPTPEPLSCVSIDIIAFGVKLSEPEMAALFPRS